MKFTDIFINRPVLAIAISIMITVFGLQSLKGMNVRQYPEITNTVITVSTSYYGAGSELIRGFITQPLQQAIAQADNIDYISSDSQMGMSTIKVYMKLNTDPNAALADILSRVNSVKSQLPAEAEDSSIALSTGATTSIMYLALASDSLSSPQITDYINRVIIPKLYTINGISKVNLLGGNEFAIRIWIKPANLAKYGLSSDQIINALKANNFQSSSGQIIGKFTVLNTNTLTQVSNIKDIKNIIISTTDEKIVRLSDVADVTLDTNHDTYRALANGKPSVLLGIDATPTANPLDIAKDVKTMLPSIKKSLPPSMTIDTVYDSTIAIESSIHEVIHTIVEAAVIVLVVITLFMGNFRAVIIPIITIPLSLIGVMLIMNVLGFTINLMTLLAMVLAIGLVVDDAIVVVENVDRNIKNGMSPYKAAILGTREIALPVISMTISLACVYAPIAMMGGVTGALFTEFSLTLAGSVFISGVIALTLSPMMCSKILKQEEKPGKFEEAVNNVLTKFNNFYGNLLDTVLHNRSPIIISAFIIFLSLPILMFYSKSELAPYEDDGVVMLLAKAPNSANLDYIQDGMKNFADIGLADNAVENVISLAGMPASNQGMSIMSLKDYALRDSADEVMNRVNAKASENPNLSATTFRLAPLPGSSSGLPVQLVIMTPDSFEQLYTVAEDILQKIKDSGLFVYTDSSLSFDSGTVEISIDRDKAGAYGVTMSDIGSTLSTMIADNYINRVAIDGRAYQVIPQVIRTDRLNPESLKGYYVKASNGKMIPITSVIKTKVITEPRVLNQMSQQNAVTLSMALNPNNTMGDAINFFNSEIIPNLPQGYMYDYTGESRQFTTEGNAIVGAFALSIIIIFLVLAIQFESWKDPFVIIVSVPLAVSGALLMVSTGLATLNIYTEVGLITLVGLITKHGILICEVSREKQLNEGLNRFEAVREAAKLRLRPILMTTAAMVAGLLPLLYASGSGAESRFSIGLVIVAGLSIGTVFTLFVLPVIYTFIGQKHKPIPNSDNI